MISFDETRLEELFERFKGKKIAVIGDLMIDQYYWGSVRRISPEAPVPVVEVDSESTRLGGAANVANNILELGGNPLLVGVVGNDHAGHELRTLLMNQNLSATGLVVDEARPTTIKTRVIAHDQHVVRVDKEVKEDCSDSVGSRIIDVLQNGIEEIDGIILEDYNKGVITKKVIRGVTAIAEKHGKIITVDPKLSNFLEFKNVTVFKPNRREVEEALGGRLRTTDDVVRAGTQLRNTLSAKNVLLTRGEDGMSLFESTGAVTHLGNVARNVQDVSGAGDTVIATLTLALAAGSSVQEAATLANCAAGVVVGYVGIVPIQREQLAASVIEYGSKVTAVA